MVRGFADVRQTRKDGQTGFREFSAAERRGDGVAVDEDRLSPRLHERPHGVEIEQYAMLARERHDENDDVDLVRLVQKLDGLLQTAGLDRLRGHVDRIARRSVRGNQRRDFRLQFRREFRHDDSIRRQHVRSPCAGPAGRRDNHGAIALRQRRAGQGRRDRHGFFRIMRFNEAIFGEDCAIGGAPSSHACRMRSRGAFAGVGLTDLGGNDGLANTRRFLGCFEKRLWFAHAFKKQHDHIGCVVADHVVEKIADAEIDLVTGADHVTEAQPHRAAAIIQRKTDAAALRDNADAARRGDVPRRAGFDIHRGTERRSDAADLVVEPFRVRPGNAHAGTPRQRGDVALQVGAGAALLRKTRRDDHTIANAGARAFFKGLQHAGGGNCDQRKIGWLTYGADRGKAAQSGNFFVARIYGIKFSSIFVLLQHALQKATDFLRVRRRADDGDAFRREKRVERAHAHGNRFTRVPVKSW